MKNNLPLNLLYRFKSFNTPDGATSLYEVLHFFSESSDLPEDLLENVYRDHFGDEYDSQKSNSLRFYFHSLDDLGEFALKVCEQVHVSEVLILSSDDYNLAIESCYDLKGFRDVFRRNGTSIVNSSLSSGKKNIFGKLFT